jgi:hypothetical protein
MDRLKELDKIAEKLEGQVVFKKTVWLIMDKTRKVIAKGVPRNRYLCMVDDIKDRKRLLTYNSERMAINGFTSSGFYRGDGVNQYLADKFGSDASLVTCLEPVKSIIVVKI